MSRRAEAAQVHMHETWRRMTQHWSIEAFAAGAADRKPFQLSRRLRAGPRRDRRPVGDLRCLEPGCTATVAWAGTGRPPHRCPVHQTARSRRRHLQYEQRKARRQLPEAA